MHRLFTWTVLFAALCFAGSAVAKEPIKIGAILSVTGPAANLGGPEARTLQMLVDEANQKGGLAGHPIELAHQGFRRQPREGHLVRQEAHRGGQGLRHHRSLDQWRDRSRSRGWPRRARPCSSRARRPRPSSSRWASGCSRRRRTTATRPAGSSSTSRRPGLPRSVSCRPTPGSARLARSRSRRWPRRWASKSWPTRSTTRRPPT